MSRRGIAMKTYALEEASQSVKDIGCEAEIEPVVLTRNGKAVAFIFSTSTVDADEVEYLKDTEFWKAIRRSRTDDSDAVLLEDYEASKAKSP